MSVYVGQTGLLVRCVPFPGDNAPIPRPGERSGITPGKVYEVLGCFNASETSESQFLLANDRQEPWWMATRHFRVEGFKNDGRTSSLDPRSV